MLFYYVWLYFFLQGAQYSLPSQQLPSSFCCPELWKDELYGPTWAVIVGRPEICTIAGNGVSVTDCKGEPLLGSNQS